MVDCLCGFYPRQYDERLRTIRVVVLVIYLFFFHPADPRGITHREVYQEFQRSYDIFHRWCQGFFSILLTNEGSHREVYQKFQPSYDIFHMGFQGFFRPQVPCTPSLHCPIAISASTQSQQPV